MISDAAMQGGEVPASKIFNDLFAHINPQVWASFHFLGLDWNITNHTILIALAGLLVLLFFWAGHARKRLGDGGIPRGRFTNLVESLVVFVRDEMVYNIMGRENGRKFAPLFLTQFFFIWMANLLGLIPLPGIGGHALSGTATSSIMVTAALASTTLIVMVACGVRSSGFIGMWTSLVPRGVPAWMWPLMFLVEVLGFFVKPFALTVRLFANMLGGHMALLALFGMVYLFGEWWVYGALMPIILLVGLLELLVAALQAFIFTFLSIIFVQGSLHPDH